MFFGAVRLSFFWIFFVSKWPLHFLIFCNKMEFQEGKRVSLLTFFGTMRLFQISNFLPEIRFSYFIPTKFFLNTFQNFDLMFGVKSNIRVFDVIPDLYCVSLKEEAEFRKQLFLMETSCAYFENCAF